MLKKIVDSYHFIYHYSTFPRDKELCYVKLPVMMCLTPGIKAKKSMNHELQNFESKLLFFLYNLMISGILIMTVRMLQFHMRTLIVMGKQMMDEN